METFADRSQTGFAAPQPYDAAADHTFGESLGKWSKATITAPVDAFSQKQALGEIYRASERQSYLVDTSTARAASMEDWFDRTAARVKQATGQQLDNPLLRNTSELAGRIGKGEFRGWSDPRIDDLISGRQDAFLERAQWLKAQHPDKLGDLDLSTPIAQQAAAAAKAASAEGAKQAAREDVNPVLQLGSEIAGGMVGSRRDPTFWISMLAAGAGRGATLIARLVSGAAADAAVNATQAAVSQPAVQAWREEAGLPHGTAEAVENVKNAAIFGAVGGAALRGVGEGAGALMRRAGGGESPPALKPEPTPLERGAQAFDDANRETLHAPATVPEAEARATFAEALTHAETPDHPPPLETPPVPPETTDALARKIVDAAETPVAAVHALRDAPEGIVSALASEDPHLRMAGRLATLTEDALAAVEQGRVTPEQGAAVAGMAHAPERQSALVALIEEQKPDSVFEARRMIADAQAAASAIESAQARVAPARPQPAGPASLVQWLAGHGLADSADLRALIDANNHFVPGRGMLIRRQGGMTLDQALRAAEDAGYFFDPGAAEGAGARMLTPSDLLDAIDGEINRGRKRYAMGDEPAPSAYELDPHAPTRRELQAATRQVKAALSKEERGLYTDAQMRAAADMVHREGVEPAAALDRVIAEEEASAVAFFNNRYSEDWRDGAARSTGELHEPDFIPFEAGDAQRIAAGSGDVGTGGGGSRSGDGGEAPAHGGEGAPAGAGEGSAGGAQGVAAAAEAGVEPRARADLIDQVPILFDDGTLRYGSLDDAFGPSRIAQNLADVVAACKA